MFVGRLFWVWLECGVLDLWVGCLGGLGALFGVCFYVCVVVFLLFCLFVVVRCLWWLTCLFITCW